MPHDPLQTTQPTPAKLPQSGWAKLASSSVLVVEAAIATLVLSTFASSNPRLLAQPLTPKPTATVTATNPNTPRNQLFSAHFPDAIALLHNVVQAHNHQAKSSK